jgi:hypothetical protein
MPTNEKKIKRIIPKRNKLLPPKSGKEKGNGLASMQIRDSWYNNFEYAGYFSLKPFFPCDLYHTKCRNRPPWRDLPVRERMAVPPLGEAPK